MTLVLLRPVRRVTDALRYYLAGLWKRLNEMPVFIWCQAMAFKVLVTILPLIVIATGIFGLLLRQDNPFDTVAGYLRTFLPPGQSEGLIRFLSELQAASGTITLLGIVLLVAAIVTFFAVLRYVVATAMGGNRETYRSILGGYAFDVRMAIQVGLLFLLSFGLTFAVNGLSVTSTEFLTNLGIDPDLLQRGWHFVLRLSTLLVPFGLSLAMFAQLYYFIPRPRPTGKSALFGAFFAAVLFELAKNGFTYYARYSGRFDRYVSTGEDALSSLGGIFGLLIAFVFWVYFSGLILIIGAILAHLFEIRNRPERSRLRRIVRRVLAQKHRREEHPEIAPPQREQEAHQEPPRADEDESNAPPPKASGDGASEAVPPAETPDVPSR